MSTSLLSIQKLSPEKNFAFPAYFVVSTAPINVEDPLVTTDSNDAQQYIKEISAYLKAHKGNAEILIVIHGYNTSKTGVQNWFESIYQHLDHYCKNRSQGFLLIGYRWPSEQIVSSEPEVEGNAQGTGSFLQNKWQSSKDALPIILGKISRWGTIGILGGLLGSVASGVAIALQVSYAALFLILSSTLIILALIAVSPIVTILLLRLAGYFRDHYRATNFGVPDLVELIRQIDYSLTQESPETEKNWGSDRIKLSFIGHSMGGFVVTNTVRILSDVFDPESVGALSGNDPKKTPSRVIGNVFCLSRLVLVSPDIPAETIISGRANFLQSSLRRFEEAYLFSNEGDMALRLASTAANYFSYPARTQAGGYRLGNVTVRTSTEGDPTPPESYGLIARFSNGQLVCLKDGKFLHLQDGIPLNLQDQKKPVSLSRFPLDYLYIREKTPLSKRQECIALAPDEKPIGELFSFFDCTDYVETCRNKHGQEVPVGMVSHARQKQPLEFNDYVALTIDYFSGKIDTHGGYFSDGERDPKKGLRPEATFSKLAIYGLACMGFERFLLQLPQESFFTETHQALLEQIQQDLTDQALGLNPDQIKKVALSQVLSSLCCSKGIQVLLCKERFTQNVLDIQEQPG